MLPAVALIGRPNVGKSTLFNRLTRSRDALVAAMPGLTRDRHYGRFRHRQHEFIVVDTGGLEMAGQVESADAQGQARLAASQADLVLFMVDARDGLVAEDQRVAEWLRGSDLSVLLVVNKVDGLEEEGACAEFHSLGLGPVHPLSAAHGRGVQRLLEAMVAMVPEPAAAGPPLPEEAVQMAVVGRPNVGKSTLVNSLLGEHRMVVGEQPGTTRDSIQVPFHRAGQDYLLVDTAGIRRRTRVRGTVEKFSVIKSLQSMEASQVVVLMVDATEGLVDQDLRLLNLAVDSGRALVLAVNKWDLLGGHQRRSLQDNLMRRLEFLDFIEIHFISALRTQGLDSLLAAVNAAFGAAGRKLSTAALTRILQQAVTRHPPPLVRGRRSRLQYAHPTGSHPPRILIHGSLVDALPQTYRRYLEHCFRDQLQIKGTPLRLEFRTGANPYAPGGGAQTAGGRKGGGGRPGGRRRSAVR